MSLIKWTPLNNEIDTFDNIIDQFFSDLSIDPRFSSMNTNSVSNYYNENEIGKKAEKIMMPMQLGDVKATIADTSSLKNWINFKPNTSIEKGIHEFVKWYRFFYKC